MRHLLAVFLVLFFSVAHGQELLGRVVGVTDGDTLTVLDTRNVQHEIRLAAIDSPETSCHQRRPSQYAEQCVEKGQAFGKAAKKSLSDLAYGRDVMVVLQPGDSYGRKIGIVWVGPIDTSLMQVTRGHAWHYKQYAKRYQSAADLAQYSNAEQVARNQRLGLWADAAPIEPWVYRREKRAQ